MNTGRIYLGLSSASAGMSATVAATLSGGLLLYSGEGLMRALSVLLAVLAISLAAGIAMDLPRGSTFRSGLRTRWRGVLLAFVVAAVFASSWGFMGDQASRPVNLALGLLLLGALPMFAIGMVLGAASRVHEWIDPPGARAFAWAIYGGAAGMLRAGAALRGTRFLPATLLMLCVVLLSAGSLLQALGIDELEGSWLDSDGSPGRAEE